ncbi:Hydroxypyruvate isomerase [Lentibacillus sp. JNUCC-1]|uniref:hydroxypyruvate isomerase family protein n=1 Tax=Lentibacillus sp. JNUCC-1 TaxID=2654513 RepID=UPI0012E88A0D|nr:TIM barrel protein [Lentibacillus sp. JNUCC-1]MUV36876.1 Hydroxypyruvate isomerase [Lentibacillus sp. JNUCC-1]
MKFSVCLDALYKDKDIYQSVEEIKRAGFSAIEFWSWWDKDIYEIKNAADQFEMDIVTFCTPFISLIDKDQLQSYKKALINSIRTAKLLNCKQLVTQIGQERSDINEQDQTEIVVAGLKACVPLLERKDITLLIEPLNTKVDHPGYFLSTAADAIDIVKRVNSSHVKILYDFYHQDMTEGVDLSSIEENINWIGHFHAASVPDRHEPDTGNLDYHPIFTTISETDYPGHMGLEYFPKADATEGLKRLAAY